MTKPNNNNIPLSWSDATEIKHFDILYCNFPYKPDANGNNYHPHYVIVTDIGIHNDTNEIMLKVAYGTSKKIDKIYKNEILISEQQVKYFNNTGLSKSTKFDFANVLSLEYNITNFIIPTNSSKTTPKVGNLLDSEMNEFTKNRLQTILKNNSDE
jgi:hypothetical protein